jgi:mannose/fructose/N-acetylgalactosamine-specific phosphotransferase system component IID
MGLTYALEKSKAEGGPVTGDVIRNIKTSLMGPLA